MFAVIRISRTVCSFFVHLFRITSLYCNNSFTLLTFYCHSPSFSPSFPFFSSFFSSWLNFLPTFFIYLSLFRAEQQTNEWKPTFFFSNMPHFAQHFAGISLAFAPFVNHRLKQALREKLLCSLAFSISAPDLGFCALSPETKKASSEQAPRG